MATNTLPEIKTKPETKRRKKRVGIYLRNVIERRVRLPFSEIGSNLNINILKKIKGMVEGKCNKEGYIKTDSVRIVSISSGVLEKEFVVYSVSFECLVCNPVENMRIRCKVVNITKAGIRAIYGDNEDKSPLINYIARDHNYNNKTFNECKVDDVIETRVIGIRYELNDNKIHVISEIIKQRSKRQATRQAKITIN